MARPKAAGNETLIELFLDMLAAERGASVNTLDAYRRDLADFSADLTAKNQTIAAADSDALRAYLGRLSKRQLAPASVARRLSAIRQLYRFLYSEGHRGDDPAAAIEGPKRGRSLPKVLSIKQVDGLLAQAQDRDAVGIEIRTASRRADGMPARSALRDRLARLRTGGAAGLGCAARPADAGDPRQGRPRAAGAAQRRGAAHDEGLSGAARGGQGR